ncbi:outer membrane lipoprotein chaperone LolA [Melaminivora sp.]
MSLLKPLFASILIAASHGWALANGVNDPNGLSSLEAFVKTARSGSASFSQTVTAPARDGQAARSKTSSGQFQFQRPGRFRFVYTRPFEQTIVADGRTLWLYDADLNQVTRRAQDQALGATPAALLTAAPDLAALRREFTLEAAPDEGGLQWVHATPKAGDGQLKSVRVGFDGPRLAVLEIEDSFGQRSTLRFSGLQLNPQLPADTFSFKPPAGADVVKQ